MLTTYPESPSPWLQSWQLHRNGPFTYSRTELLSCVISRVTSFFASSIFSFDSARIVLVTTSWISLVELATIWMEPNTLSTSNAFWAEVVIGNDFLMVSCSLTFMSEAQRSWSCDVTAATDLVKSGEAG